MIVDGVCVRKTVIITVAVVIRIYFLIPNIIADGLYIKSALCI